jgi:hypothetical protein
MARGSRGVRAGSTHTGELGHGSAARKIDYAGQGPADGPCRWPDREQASGRHGHRPGRASAEQLRFRAALRRSEPDGGELPSRLLRLSRRGDRLLPERVGLRVQAMHPPAEPARSQNLPARPLFLSRRGYRVLPQWLALRIDALHQAGQAAEPVTFFAGARLPVRSGGPVVVDWQASARIRVRVLPGAIR